ncbi:MAG: putative RDD family membrane protein YckC [Saprospiraceae bacterium]|jgi:uncharacterized RDD family membrane protein YckC
MSEEQNYGGFWIRAGATIIDTICVLVIILPILSLIYGTEYWENESFLMGAWDALLNYIIPAAAVLAFWIYKSATPGKLLTHLSIVDAKTGGKPSTRQFVIRYLGYYVSGIPLGLGFFWVAFDKRKQGWHDKIAGTVVIWEA